jgi:putative ATPase
MINKNLNKPLYEIMRPKCLDDVIGQSEILGPRSLIGKSLNSGTVPSVIFWGPPGTGKTTIAKLLSESIDAEFITISAVMSGVKEIREAISKASLVKQDKRKVIVFVDEVHRFNKSQQDAFLPHIESGLFIFFGATTENPGFEINSALQSRTQILVLKRLTKNSLEELFRKALRFFCISDGVFSTMAKDTIIDYADGDARRLLSIIESSVITLYTSDNKKINEEMVRENLPFIHRIFDKHGNEFYDQISALHKSIRGSDPDASLYWLVRMLDGGIQPKYLARRLIRIASEDIGLADPRALRISLDAYDAYERLGSPEGEIVLAEATIYLSIAAKSNSVYKAFKMSKKFVSENGSDPVPLHLRNVPTYLKKK